MPVFSKEEHKNIIFELNNRVNTVFNLITDRPLLHKGEGLTGRKQWFNPDRMIGTRGTQRDIDLAINDLITILKSIK